MHESNPWKWSTVILSILLVSCFGWYFLKGSQIGKTPSDDFDVEDNLILTPSHEGEPGPEDSSLEMPTDESDAPKGPIRKISTIDTGDSFYKVLLQYGIPHTSIFEILREVRGVFDLSKVMPGHELILVFSPDNHNLIGVEYEISPDRRLIVSIDEDNIQAHKKNSEAEQPEELLPAADSGLLKHTDYIVKQGDNLFNILSDCGVSALQINQVLKSVKETYDLSDLSIGNTLSICVTTEEPVSLIRMSYRIDDFNSLEVEKDVEDFKASKKTFEVDVRYERAEGTITSSLYESAVQAGISPEIVMGLTDVFTWDINFFTDIQEGDSYTVLYERYYVQNGFKGYGRVIAAKFNNQGNEHVAVYYRNGEKIEGYYDEKGKPIQKLFIKAPLNFRRISSGFSFRRMHPIFHVIKPHLGVDYAAPAGTPVVALGDGSVFFKGWSKGFGNAIQLKHPRGYVTYYGHLSGFEKGLSKGKRVSQGEIIGYVGSTGNSTGPHLDFRISLRGKFLNPQELKSVSGPPLNGRALARFKEISARRLAMLDDSSLNYTTQIPGNPGSLITQNSRQSPGKTSDRL